MTRYDNTYPAFQSGTSFGVTSHRRWLLRGEAMGRILTKAFAAMRRISNARSGSLRPQPALKSSLSPLWTMNLPKRRTRKVVSALMVENRTTNGVTEVATGLAG
ncbi:hypothetical protein VSX64_23290 [Aurantimonas sp. C2-6-R+9]|uniref:hypothetical protein n=1 Tax=unclassified Aurantimonas TaxID=2638230 RepID=UPI002E192E8A|nr:MULTISPECIES: hypothetical protein [unclassified Aurantimonas]MEC5293504.1 hypothetical protein [Aurantimonas sp. C2-3-R2]MEC5383680.1 hypothetical protein [Aurantimonas sp. C2-6-R+9]MEC5414581.1 hypothetical protein [Aurantimonas sp. C2-4-R8]